MWANARVRTARKRRQRLERRADAEAKLTSEVLAAADLIGDVVADVRQGIAADARHDRHLRELERLRGISRGAAGGGPEPAPAAPPLGVAVGEPPAAPVRR